MHLRLVIVAAVAVGATIASQPAPAASPTLGGAANAGPNTFTCKVLRKALNGTVVGHHATHFSAADSTTCVYDDGTTGARHAQWAATLDLGPHGGSIAVARAECKAWLSQIATAGWLTRAQTGADAACWFVKTPEPQGKPPYKDTFAYASKGRWSVQLDLTTPPSGGGRGYIAFLVKEVTAQLPQ